MTRDRLDDVQRFPGYDDVLKVPAKTVTCDETDFFSDNRPALPATSLSVSSMSMRPPRCVNIMACHEANYGASMLMLKQRF